jgi:DNA invertase Pin-like site-specific DNA recombinase
LLQKLADAVQKPTSIIIAIAQAVKPAGNPARNLLHPGLALAGGVNRQLFGYVPSLPRAAEFRTRAGPRNSEQVMTPMTSMTTEQTGGNYVAPHDRAKWPSGRTRAALYVRVSTKEQTAENQERELRQWADRLGFQVVRVYADTASGARADRAALAAVLEGARLREYDMLLTWALDRLSREGIGAMARYIEQLRAAGIRVMSHQEPWLDTSGPVGELLVAIFAWVAQQERERIGQRIKAGQARARAHGVRLGRKPRVVDLEDLRHRRVRGESWRRIARAHRVPVRTLRRAWQNSQGEFRRGQAGSTRGLEDPEVEART